MGIVTFLIYLPVKDARFLIYDDNLYVTENSNVTSGLSLEGLRWAFTTDHAGNYHPITWLSHQLDCQLFGLNPARHHWMNVAVHCANAVLLFTFLFQWTGGLWRSAVVAALFAWHPMHVESVAWIAERKDTLCALFWLLTMLAYGGYVKRRSNFSYLLVLLLFALALLAKPMAVTLPFVLLLLDYWPLNRMHGSSANPYAHPFKKLLLEKLPLILLSAMDCIVTFQFQKSSGAMSNIHPSLLVRLMNSITAYAEYIFKLSWPSNLAVLYPYRQAPNLGMFLVAFVFLAAVSCGVLWRMKTMRYLFAGWCWFLGSLVPVIGLVQVGEQGMADRYSYLPSVGLFIMLVFWMGEMAARRTALKPVFVGLVATVLGICLWLSHRQCSYWNNGETLFRHDLEAAGSTAISEYYLAYIYGDMGRQAECVEHYAKSLKLDPTQYLANNNLGVSLAKLGRHAEATNAFARALELNPNLPVTHLNFGESLEELGDGAGAFEHYQSALRQMPESAPAHFKLGMLHLRRQEFGLAQAELERAATLDPTLDEPHQKLANLLGNMGDAQAAIRENEIALRLNPNNVAALNDLAWIRASSADAALRSGSEAVRLASKACELTQQTQPYLLGTLANAYAEAGRFEDAVATAQKAVELALKAKLPEVAERNRQLILLYQSKQAFHADATNKP